MVSMMPMMPMVSMVPMVPMVSIVPMKNKPRLLLFFAILVAVVAAVWRIASRRPRFDPVEQIVADMVPIPDTSFLMGKYEVTQAQWEAVMEKNPSRFKGVDHPVENVSWDDCQVFLKRLNANPAAQKAGLVFRLPTDEEWNAACRAGSANNICRLADGTEITENTLGYVAWVGESERIRRPAAMERIFGFAEEVVDIVVADVDFQPRLSTHHPVGRKTPNAYGLHDMFGNVWEWTQTSDGGNRIYLGGSWTGPIGWGVTNNGRTMRDLSPFSSVSDSPSSRYDALGFRLCARFVQTPAAPDFSRRASLGESGSFPIVRDWLLSYGPGEATADGIPKWIVEIVKGTDPANRLLPNEWHGLQSCEVAPALVATNETRVLPVRGAPWLLRLTLENVGVRGDRSAYGWVGLNLVPRFAAPVVASSGAALSLRQNPEGGPPELRLLRNGEERRLGTAEDFAGEWDEDAWIDAVAFTNVLGADGFAITTSVGLHCGTTYFAEKDGGLVPLATSWRPDDAFLDPLSSGRMDFAVDLDGDGVRELVCNVEQWAHDCTWPRTFWPHVHIFRFADGFVEECGDMMPLLDEPARAVPKRFAESHWSPSSGNISIVFETEDGERRAFFLAPDLARLTFTRTESRGTLKGDKGVNDVIE